MINLKVLISIFVFSMLLVLTSTIKTKTRIIEKNIKVLNKDIFAIKKDLHETELDFFYLSSPQNLTDKITSLSLTNYVPMDFSRIYLNSEDFYRSEKKISILKKNNEKKEKE